MNKLAVAAELVKMAKSLTSEDRNPRRLFTILLVALSDLREDTRYDKRELTELINQVEEAESTFVTMARKAGGTYIKLI